MLIISPKNERNRACWNRRR